MTIKLRPIAVIFLITLLTTTLGFFAGKYFFPSSDRISTTLLPITRLGQTPTPSPTPTLPAPKISSQISPDGSIQLLLETIYHPHGTKSFTLSTIDGSGANPHPVFTTIQQDSTSAMSIPFNTWSPDNRYFFVQSQASASASLDILAFQATGQPFADGNPFINVTDLFKQRNTGYTFDQATGWASNTLILVNTFKSDTTKGPSFWFEIPSKAIIQLFTQF